MMRALGNDEAWRKAALSMASFSIGLILDANCSASAGGSGSTTTAKSWIPSKHGRRTRSALARHEAGRRHGRRYTPKVSASITRRQETVRNPCNCYREHDYFRTFNLDYHAVKKYPHLTRDESKPDM